MEVIENFFVANFTSIALYRSGNATGPRLNQVRIPPREGTIDIEIYEKEVNGKTIIYVDSTSGGYQHLMHLCQVKIRKCDGGKYRLVLSFLMGLLSLKIIRLNQLILPITRLDRLKICH